jgi:hypothetical protein
LLLNAYLTAKVMNWGLQIKWSNQAEPLHTVPYQRHYVCWLSIWLVTLGRCMHGDVSKILYCMLCSWCCCFLLYLPYLHGHASTYDTVMFIFIWSRYLQFVTILMSICSSLLLLHNSVLRFTSLCLTVWNSLHAFQSTYHFTIHHMGIVHCITSPCLVTVVLVRFLSSLVYMWETRHNEFLEAL